MLRRHIIEQRSILVCSRICTPIFISAPFITPFLTKTAPVIRVPFFIINFFFCLIHGDTAPKDRGRSILLFAIPVKFPETIAVPLRPEDRGFSNITHSDRSNRGWHQRSKDGLPYHGFNPSYAGDLSKLTEYRKRIRQTAVKMFHCWTLHPLSRYLHRNTSLPHPICEECFGQGLRRHR